MIILPALFAVLVLCAIAAIAFAVMCRDFTQNSGFDGAPAVCGVLSVAFGIAAVISAARIVIVCSGWGG